MINSLRRGAVAALLLGASSAMVQPVAAQAVTPVVSGSWLARELARPDLVVLQLGTAAAFALGHIPGAVRLSFDSVMIAPPAEGALRMELPTTAQLEAGLRALGVSNNSRIVIVFDTPQAFTRAGRTFFTLEWAGLRDRVGVLDGGLPAWKAAGGYVATGAGKRVTGGDVKLTPDAARVASRDTVRAASEGRGRQLVDARAPEFFTPASAGGNANGGHIASAVSLPFTGATTPDGRFKSRAELEQLVIAAGILPDEQLTTYCHIGLQASWMYLTLRHLGRDVTLYDGSYEEWSRSR